MHAVQIHTYGGPDALRYEEVPQPEPGQGEVRVHIEAAGLNYIDVYHRTGRYPGSLPRIPGSEAAGIVDAVGPGVTEFKPGDRVAYAMQEGSYADYVVVPGSKLMRVPAGISIQQAAAVMLQGMTAHYLAFDTFALQPGQTALVHAAAGGVGLLLVQIAKRCGAQVIGTVSTAEKARLATEAGADHIIRYTDVDFEGETKRLTGDRGVDVVYDSVGKTTFDKSLNCLRPRGYLVLYGQSSGVVGALDPQILNARGSLFLTRPSLRHYVATREDLVRRANDLYTWMAAGELSVRIDRTFPLAEAAAAHRYLESRQTKGKVLLIP